MTVAVIIPAYNPESFLVDFAKQIMKQNLKNIIIVDDGSINEYTDVFKQLKNIGCIVIHHKKNSGKGASIKYGIKKAMSVFPQLDGCITAEANNQHSPKDLRKIYDAMQKHPGKLIMGTRKLRSNKLPLKFRVSFYFSKIYVRIMTKKWYKDARTILRGIPKEMFSLALSTEGERYEYELNFFINAIKNNYPYINVHVGSHLSKNHISHFRPFIDTILLFKTLIKFAATSLSCYIIDLLLFTLFSYFIFPSNAVGLFGSTVIARIISGIMNFTINKKWSFENHKQWKGQFAKYIMLFVTQMTLSWLLVTTFSALPIPIFIVKMAVDLALFVLNYLVQKNWVFKDK